MKALVFAGFPTTTTCNRMTELGLQTGNIKYTMYIE